MFKSLAAALTIIPLVAGQSGPQAKRIPKCISAATYGNIPVGVQLLEPLQHQLSCIPRGGIIPFSVQSTWADPESILLSQNNPANPFNPTRKKVFEYLFNDVCKKYGYFIPQNSTNPAEFSRNNKISSATPTPTPTPSLTPGYPGETSSPAPAEYTGAAVSNTKSTDVGFYALLSLLFAGAVAV
ncbi:MAG: hypothetical protein M1831_001056 [Alyxoria varia]|nr:MAG: hypothetical protein M1831_001056 [Alyxoria varia]